MAQVQNKFSFSAYLTERIVFWPELFGKILRLSLLNSDDGFLFAMSGHELDIRTSRRSRDTYNVLS